MTNPTAPKTTPMRAIKATQRYRPDRPIFHPFGVGARSSGPSMTGSGSVFGSTSVVALRLEINLSQASPFKYPPKSMATSSKPIPNLSIENLRRTFSPLPLYSKRLAQQVFFRLSKLVGLGNPLTVLLFPSKDPEKGSLFQIGQGILPFPVNPWEQILFFG